MKKPLFIYGAGGLGREILSLIRAFDQWEAEGFIDDAVVAGEMIKGIPVLGGIGVLKNIDGPVNMVLAIGDPVVKQTLVKTLSRYDVRYPVLVHPAAILQDRSSIVLGNGCVIAAGCILTTDIHLGDHVLVNLNTTIGHDTRIGSCTSIMCGVNVAGEVTIGESVMIGSGACILNRITVGNQCRIGMSAAVVNNVGDQLTVIGVPAKPVGQ